MRRMHDVFKQKRTPFDVQVQVIQAILDEILSFDPSAFETFDELYHMLALAGQTATNQILEDLVKHYLGKVDPIIQKERERFERELKTLDRRQLSAVQPLPYIRTLTLNEATVLWKQITPLWKLQHNHWYPIYGPPRPANALAFETEVFDAHLPPAKLQDILRNHGVDWVYQFSEGSPSGIQKGFPEIETELALLSPRYGIAGGLEGYWFSKEMDWLLYASHESSITVGGLWLIEEIKRMWPSWGDGLYEKYPIARFHLGDYAPDL